MYWNNVEYNNPVDEEFKNLWQSLRVPTERDVREELKAGGHTVLTEELSHLNDAKIQQEEKRKEKKKKSTFRKPKTTNVHLDFNIWEDPTVKQPSNSANSK